MPPELSIQKEVYLALCEDLPFCSLGYDLSGKLLTQLGQKDIKAEVHTNSPGVLCGIAWFEYALWLLDKEVRMNWEKFEGDSIKAGDKICQVTGNSAAILAAERTCLNFLQLLSGVATRSRALADIATAYHKSSGKSKTGKAKQVKIFDTRKTLPGLRLAQKYAVKVGGCVNHRFSLNDAIMLKENHLATAGGDINKLIRETAKFAGHAPVIMEVETLTQLKDVFDALHQNQPQALPNAGKAGESINKSGDKNPVKSQDQIPDKNLKKDASKNTEARTPESPDTKEADTESQSAHEVTESSGPPQLDVILLDNFSIPDIKKAVAMREKQLGKLPANTIPEFEISGAVNQDNLKDYLALGAERISVGWLTKEANPLDFSMRFTSNS